MIIIMVTINIIDNDDKNTSSLIYTKSTSISGVIVSIPGKKSGLIFSRNVLSDNCTYISASQHTSIYVINKY